MSCQLKTVSCLADCAAIKKFLYHNTRSFNSTGSKGGLDDNLYNRWDDNEMTDSERILDQSWLQDCLVSLSPTADFLALATNERVMFLTLKWDLHEESEIKAKFNCLWESVLVEDKNEEISSILCIPLASQKRSSQGGVDWTCIIVGFTTGYVKMYTETGVQLLSQIFHEGPVVRLNCRTYEPPRHSKSSEQQEELVILYPWSVVTIEGFSLYQTLRACRNQVAKATASGIDVSSPPPLAYKKWGIKNQYKINDCQNLGLISSNAFDHLQTASLLGGFNAVPRNSIPIASLVLVAGQSPYLSFYYAMEGASPPLISEVAIAVASKLKSYFFSAASGILGFSNKAPNESQQLKPKIEPSTPLDCRFALPDTRRTGDNISVSPNKTLVAVTDSFGRVVLIDLHLGIAVRMWKGYRDAQCGWLEVIEDTHQQDKEKVTPVPRVAIYLIIYAPRRGLLEVWTTQQGPRVAAFNVSKWARLICPGYGLMGLNSPGTNHRKCSFSQCFLLDPDGPVKILSVPFHYALGDKNSKRAQSLHLLRKIKISLKECNVDDEKFSSEITKTILDIRTASIRQQALETLVNNKKVGFSLLETVVTAASEQLELQEFECMDFESKQMVQSCRRLKQLLQLYKVASDMNQNQPPSSLANLVNSDDYPLEPLASLLYLSASDTEQMKMLLQHYQTNIKMKSVYFSDEKNLTPSAFISCFQVFIPQLNRNQTNVTSLLPVELNLEVTKERMEILGCFLFKSHLQGSKSSQDLEIALLNCGILPDKLMILLLEFCLSQIAWLISWDCVNSYFATVKFITNLQDSKSYHVSFNEISPWWQNIRTILTQSINSQLVYISSLVCRGVALMFASQFIDNEMKNEENNDKEGEKCEEDDTDKQISEVAVLSPGEGPFNGDTNLNDWENISMEIMQWNLLVKQSEDLIVLSCLLNYQKANTHHNDNSQELSLAYLSEKGRGIVSELVGEWLIRSNLDDHLLDLPKNGNDKKLEVEIAKEVVEELQLDIISKADDLLKLVRKRFPFSLHPEVLAANCSWERAALWNKDADVIVHLEKAIASLQLITNAILKHGVATMIWHMLVSKRFTNAALLMEKVGKPPKERLCRRDIGITDTTLEKFLSVCVDLLDIIIEANIACHSEFPPACNYEDFWQNHQGPTPLIEVALSQKNTNYELICHHYQLALSMLMIVTFNIKNYRPISFYDTKGKSAFFRELHAYPLMPAQDLDLAIINNRTWFLCKVISAAVESVPEPIPDTVNFEASQFPAVKLVSITMSHWVGKVMDLAKLWGVDTDLLRRHHICELYSSGLDSLAEEMLPAVNDTIVMGSQLILLAGQRLYYAIKKKFSSIDTFSMVSPNLSTWLKTLDQSKLRNMYPPLPMTATLISHVINHLPEGHCEYQMALSLVDAIHTLMDYPSEAARMITSTG